MEEISTGERGLDLFCITKKVEMFRNGITGSRVFDLTLEKTLWLKNEFHFDFAVKPSEGHLN